jgi:hypothetical protein
MLYGDNVYPFLLHGTRYASLSTLTPQYSVDTFEHKGARTAVFATDQPLIALARGAAGNSLSIWTKQVFFGYKDQPDFSQPGYIYLLPRTQFNQHPNDKSEYLSPDEVMAVKKIRFDSTVMQPLLRPSQDVYDALDPVTGLIREDKIRESDITAALLTSRNLLSLCGVIDYATDPMSLQMDYFARLANILPTLDPVLKQIKQKGTSEQRALANNIYRHFDHHTSGDIYGAHGLAQDLYEDINRILRPYLRTN